MDEILSDKDLKDILDKEAKRINNPDFIDKDPVQFPRMFSKQQDIEAMSFLSAMIAWGNRKMICNNIKKMIFLMDNNPYEFIMDGAFEPLDPKMNIHRTFFASHFKYFLRGLQRIFKDYGTIDAFAMSKEVGDDEFPAWKLVSEMQNILIAENSGKSCSRCLPLNLKTSALKRVNMALRWLVRNDGIVDIGIWKSIPKNKLFIPLDVHVGNTARALGLLDRKANDRKSVEFLTDKLKTFNPEDPIIYDYALFGLGIEKSVSYLRED